jgi:tetratricopeptide (TPR) repeat protein
MKRVVLAVGIAAILGLFAADASAQHGNVTGKVVDQDGQPIVGAVAKLVSPKGDMRGFDAKTNKKGEFTIVVLMFAGPWQLTISAAGYDDYKLPEPFKVNLGGPPMEMGTYKLLKAGAAGAKYVTKEEAAKLQAENKAIQAQFAQAVQITQEGDTAMDAGDKATADAKYDEAVALYQQMITANPQISELQHNVGYIMARRKQWAQSAEAYAKAVELKPEMVGDYASAAVAYQNAGNRAKALEILKDGEAKNPTSGKIQVALGEVYYNGAQYPEGIAAFNKALELEPANPEPEYFLGMIAVVQNRTRDAIAALEKYLAANPTNAQNVEAAKGVLGALKPAGPAKK